MTEKKEKPPERGLWIRLTPPKCYTPASDWTANTFANCHAQIVARTEPNDDGTPQRIPYETPGAYSTAIPHWPGLTYSAQHDVGRMIESADLWGASIRWYGHRIAYDHTYSSTPLDLRHVTVMQKTLAMLDRKATRYAEMIPESRLPTLGEHLARFAVLVGATFVVVIREGIDSTETRHEDSPATAAQVIDGWTETIAQAARQARQTAA